MSWILMARKDIVVIMNQYASRSDGNTIHSKGQMEHLGLKVYGTPVSCGGKQLIILREGYVVPLHVKSGLHYMKMHPPSDEELTQLPHVFLTSDAEWNPECLDNDGPDLSNINEDPEVEERVEQRDRRLNDYGERVPYKVRTVTFDEAEDLDEGDAVSSTPRLITKMVAKRAGEAHFDRKDVKAEDKIPNFGFLPLDRIKKTLEGTTRHYRAKTHIPFRKHYKSRFPGANVTRLAEWFSTDDVELPEQLPDVGVTEWNLAKHLQIFGGKKSGVIVVNPMREKKDFPDALEDFIRDWGAPIGIFSDNAKQQIQESVRDIYRMYCIKDAQNEPHYQHQNPCERTIQNLMRSSNEVAKRTGTPKCYFALVVMYVADLLNHCARPDGKIPLQELGNEVVDVSAFCDYHFWQEVYCLDNDGQEILGRWCGRAKNQGDCLTYLIMNVKTGILLTRSNVRPARDPMFPNRYVIPDHVDHPVLRTKSEETGEYSPIFAPDELIGMTFEYMLEDGEMSKAKVARKVLEQEGDNKNNVKFLLTIDDEEFDRLLSYNELCDLIEDKKNDGDLLEEDPKEKTYGFRDITGHVGPLDVNDERRIQGRWNVEVEWDDGTKTWEALETMAKDDPISCARYAKKHGLLNTPGWKRFKGHAMQVRKLLSAIRESNTAKKKQNLGDPNYCRTKYGIRVPRNYKEAMALDKLNGNTKWADAIGDEMGKIKKYKTAVSLGKFAKVPEGYNRITVHLVFDVKPTGKCKARLVAAGNQAPTPVESVSSSVASLLGVRIATFIGALNGLEMWCGDIGNAYLEAKTQEKIVFRAGPEWGELEGHLMKCDKALYGLASSGLRFHEKLSKDLRDMGFKMCEALNDVWMRDCGDHYEYLVVYVDDIIYIGKNPREFFNTLGPGKYKYTLKDVGPAKFHLGADFFKDDDGTQCYGSQTYAKRFLEHYEQIMGEKPKPRMSPLSRDERPELDTTEDCNENELNQYQSVIGGAQWLVSIGRFDIAHAVMTLGRFRAMPKKGHLESLKQLAGYIRKFPHAAIRFRTEIPDHEATFGPPKRESWMETPYGDAKEEIPENAPVPKGKMVRTTTFVDANLMHDVVTGRSCTGCLHFLNQTPISAFSKRQNQVETATFGSEFMAARQAVEQIIEMRQTLRMLGVPIDGPSWLFGDNKSVVTSSTLPYSTLSKRWNLLSYCRCREAIAAGIVRFEHIPGSENAADMLTKALPHSTARIYVEPLLFWKGDTQDIGDRTASTMNKSSKVPPMPSEGPSQDLTLSDATSDFQLRSQTEGSDVNPVGPHVKDGKAHEGGESSKDSVPPNRDQEAAKATAGLMMDKDSDSEAAVDGDGWTVVPSRKKRPKGILRESSYSNRMANHSDKDRKKLCLEQDVRGSQGHDKAPEQDQDDYRVEPSTDSTDEQENELVWWTKKWVKVE